jgi:Ca2+-binding RTX toxin-like protein
MDDVLGDVRVEFRNGQMQNGAMINAIIIDGREMTENQSLYVEGQGYEEGGSYYSGFAGNDTIYGGRGADALYGGAGDDIIYSGVGGDFVAGGSGADQFVFDAALGNGGMDLIDDFTQALDRIVLKQDIFAELNAGELSSDRLYVGAGVTSAQNSEQRIVLDTMTGGLYYDQDGVGGMASVQFAILGDSADKSLTGSDFFVV